MVPTCDEPDVLIVGLGYVGLNLTATLLDAGRTVVGLDTNAELINRLEMGEPMHEPGLTGALVAGQKRLKLLTYSPADLPNIVVVCVGTPFDRVRAEPDLADLHDAIDDLAPRLTSEHLLILRSTLPVGASEKIVARIYDAALVEPMIAYCPDRTIQGIAMQELRRLPQIVGGSSSAAVEAATRFFSTVTSSVLPVSSLRAAEFVKHANNSHTDVLYAMGNELAFASEAFGLDIDEILTAANLDYPRPDLAQPGWVGGSCLTKDPLTFEWSAKLAGTELALIPAARLVNERVAAGAASFISSSLNDNPPNKVVLLAGIAYKGQPETDDVRGGAAIAIKTLLTDRSLSFLGHDFVVPPSHIEALGIVPTPLQEGIAKADAILFGNDHPEYTEQLSDECSAALLADKVIYDIWGVVPGKVATRLGDNYLRLGCG